MKRHDSQAGFSAVIALVAVLVIAGAGFAAWRISQSPKENQTDQNTTAGSSTSEEKDEAASWSLITSQGGGFSIRLPDGWKATNYPDDFLGVTNLTHKPGTPPEVETQDTPYVGHSLPFRVSITALDDAGLGPQWASPQTGLEETAQNFTIGTLEGKRYKGIFTNSINQTLYEYVFAIGSDRKLDIVYTIDHNESDADNVALIEKVIKTITPN